MLYNENGSLRAPKSVRVILAGVIALAAVGYLVHEFLHDKAPIALTDNLQLMPEKVLDPSNDNFMVIDPTGSNHTVVTAGGITPLKAYYVCPIACAIKEGAYDNSRRAWNADTLEVSLGLWNSRQSGQPLTKACLRINAAAIATSLEKPIQFRFAPGTDSTGRSYGDVRNGEFKPLVENPGLKFKFIADSLVKQIPDGHEMLCVYFPVQVLNTTPPTSATKYLPLSVKVHRRQKNMGSNTARKGSETSQADHRFARLDPAKP